MLPTIPRPILSCILLACCLPASAKGIYVTKTGSDDAPGTKEEPLATVEKAVAMMRRAGPGTIWIGPGEYELSQGIWLDAQHGGTADLCVLRKPEATALYNVIVQKTGLSRQQILLNWSHPHSGPMLGTSDTNRYPIKDADLQATTAYTAQLWDRLAGVAAEALAGMEPARLSWGRGEIDFVANRRRFDADGDYRGMGPNPDGHTDRTVPVLRIDAPDGRLRGLVFGTASCRRLRSARIFRVFRRVGTPVLPWPIRRSTWIVPGGKTWQAISCSAQAASIQAAIRSRSCWIRTKADSEITKRLVSGWHAAPNSDVDCCWNLAPLPKISRTLMPCCTRLPAPCRMDRSVVACSTASASNWITKIWVRNSV